MASSYKIERKPKVRVIVMLDPEEVANIDKIGLGKAMQSRSEAIRFLLDIGVKVATPSLEQGFEDKMAATK